MIRGLLWILEHRHKPNGAAMSRRGLSILAGLTAGHVEQILNGRVDAAKIERSTALGLARAGNVRLTWLLTGAGPVEPFLEDEASATRTELDDEPDRAAVVDLARSRGIEERYLSALAKVRHHSGTSPTRAFWWEELERLIAEDREYGPRIERAAVGEHETKPKIPARKR